MNQTIQNILTYFRNITLRSIGDTRDFNERLLDRDIDHALQMLSNRDDEVDEALKEYNPQTHVVMRRPNKPRKNDAPYITEKLPRTRQRYINEVELFFLLGRPIVWTKKEGDDETYSLFTKFLDDQHFNSRIRQAKRLAGAETESALLFHIFRDDKDERQIKSLVLARSTGYRLRPLIDQYGNMNAFGYGYYLNEGGRRVEHWDFQTPQMNFYCKKAVIGWEVDMYPNPTGKINVIYFRQPKAWDGAEKRIEREEMLDSKTADTNNYFGDPMAAATADVIDSLADPDKPGKLIQLTGSNSRFEYINPPQAPEIRRAEKEELKQSILFDTFTPDFDFEKMRGMGTLSGVAIRNAMVLGYIKRDNRKEVYLELMGRFRNLALSILKYMHPDKAEALDKLEIDFEFAEPFGDDEQSKWATIAQMYSAGVISLEEAVEQLAICDHPDAEVKRIREAEKEKLEAAQAAKTPQTPPADTERQRDTEPQPDTKKPIVA